MLISQLRIAIIVLNLICLNACKAKMSGFLLQGDVAELDELDFSCIDKTMETFAISKSQAADKKLVMDIFKNDMNLSDLKPMKELLQLKLSEKDGLAKFIQKFRYALASKHPNIVEMLCEVNQKQTFTKLTKIDPRLNRMIHHMYILDEILDSVYNSEYLLISLRKHFYGKRKNIQSSELRSQRSFQNFERLNKTFFHLNKENLDWVLSKHEEVDITGVNSLDSVAKIQRSLLDSLDYATSLDKSAGYQQSAAVGNKLRRDVPKVNTIDKRAQVYSFETSDAWTKLHLTRNLSQILTHMKKMEMLLAHALLPEVLSASADQYLHKQGLAMWMGANFVILDGKVTDGDFDFSEFADRLRSVSAKHARSLKVDIN